MRSPVTPARREAEILMVERGPYGSYANCGLPYHVGSVIGMVMCIDASARLETV